MMNRQYVFSAIHLCHPIRVSASGTPIANINKCYKNNNISCSKTRFCGSGTVTMCGPTQTNIQKLNCFTESCSVVLMPPCRLSTRLPVVTYDSTLPNVASVSLEKESPCKHFTSSKTVVQLRILLTHVYCL